MANTYEQDYEFALDFVATSDRYREQYIETWREVLSNFMVKPLDDTRSRVSVDPYRRNSVYSGSRDRVILKDPETHKAVMTYASKLCRTLYGDRNREYINAKPRGWEDSTQKAPTVSRLLRYDMALPGTFRTLVEAKIDMLLFGTSIVESHWHYEEREMPVRTVTSELGVETDEFVRMRIPVYDDPRLTVLDVMDAYPDPTRYRIQDMTGFAKRFRMNSIEANAMVEKGIYKADAVKRAIANRGKKSASSSPWRETFRAGVDQPETASSRSPFDDMIGYEYWGGVPYEDDAGVSRKVITCLNNEVVRSIPWPLADPNLPFHTFIINPVQGRFYGISPAEVIRHDQDFADALKMLLAEAVIRSVHPPIAYDPDSEVDPSKILRWKADTLIPARGGPGAVGTLQYRFDANSGFTMLGGLKNSMQEASGALGAIQGEEGPDRESATGYAGRVRSAMDRPELAAMVIENECLPPIGEAFLRRNQQFLDTEGLRSRVGELPESAWIGDIMGDFDVEFVGSRMEMTRQEKLQSYDRLVALSSAIPPLMMQIPWDAIGRNLIGDVLELPEIAAQIGNQQQVMMNALLSQVAGAKGPAGSPRSSEAPGMSPAQVGGGAVGS